MPRTRCSRASSSTLGSAPRVALGGLRVGGLGVGGLRISVSGLRVGAARVGGSLARSVGDGNGGLGRRRGLALGVRFGTFGHRGLVLGGAVLGGAVLGGAVLGGAVLGGAVLGSTAPGGL